MSKNNKILSDISKMLSSGFSTMMSLKNEICSYASEKMKCMLKDLDCASKKDLNSLKNAVNHIKEDVDNIKATKKKNSDNAKEKSAPVEKVKKPRAPKVKK